MDDRELLGGIGAMGASTVPELINLFPDIPKQDVRMAVRRLERKGLAYYGFCGEGLKLSEEGLDAYRRMR